MNAVLTMETLVVACLIAAVVVFILDMVSPKERVYSKEQPNNLKWVAMGCEVAAGKKTENFIIWCVSPAVINMLIIVLKTTLRYNVNRVDVFVLSKSHAFEFSISISILYNFSEIYSNQYRYFNIDVLSSLCFNVLNYDNKMMIWNTKYISTNFLH